MSDIIETKRKINGEATVPTGRSKTVAETITEKMTPVSGNESASPVTYKVTDPAEPVAVAPVKAAAETPAETPAPKKRRPGPGRPVTTGNAHYSKAELAARDRRQRERERDLIRDEREFERETAEFERQFERDRVLAERQAQIEARLAEFEFTQRSKELTEAERRAEPLSPLRKGVLYGTLTLSLLILLASAIYSFATIADVGEWLKAPWPWLAFLLPVATEFFIVFGGMDALISQARGDKKGARIGLWVMIGASMVAVLANGAHALSEWQIEDPGLTDWRAYVGIFLSALIPIATVIASKRAIALVFSKAE